MFGLIRIFSPAVPQLTTGVFFHTSLSCFMVCRTKSSVKVQFWKVKVINMKWCFWKNTPLVCKGQLYLRASGDGNNRTARPVPGEEMCCPGQTMGREGA